MVRVGRSVRPGSVRPGAADGVSAPCDPSARLGAAGPRGATSAAPPAETGTAPPAAPAPRAAPLPPGRPTRVIRASRSAAAAACSSVGRDTSLARIAVDSVILIPAMPPVSPHFPS